MSGDRISLKELRERAEVAAEWMPNDPWELARHCYAGTIGYVAGLPGHEFEQKPAAEAFCDDLTPSVVLALVEAVEAVADVVRQDLFPDPDCPSGPGCEGCLVDAMEGKRRLVAALARFKDYEGEQ